MTKIPGTLPVFHVERVNTHRRLPLWNLLALVLLPLLVSGVLLGAAWGRDGRLTRIEAAVVNQDKAVEINGQPVPLGRQLSAEIAAKQSNNITWHLSDPSDAAEGLASGRYAAVVTIPENFSAAATSFKSPDGAQQATIDVQTSPASAVQDAEIARQIADLASQSTNKMLTGSYLDNIYVGFNSMGKQLTTMGKGAGQLADGSEQLSDGVGKAAAGAGELGKGLQQLDDNSGQLVDGGAKLADGAEQLASGGRQLADGAGALSAGGGKLAAGAGKLADGAPALTSGADQLAAGLGRYTDGTGKVVDGIGQLAGGINQLESGLSAGLSGGDSGQLGQLDQLTTGSRQLADGAAGLNQGIASYQSQLVAWRDGTAPIPPQVLEVYTDQFGEQCGSRIAEGMRTALTPARIDQYERELRAQLAAQLDQLPAELAVTAQQKAEILALVKVPAKDQLNQLLTDPATVTQVVETVCPQVSQLAQPAFEGGFQAGAGTAAAALDFKDPATGQSLKSGSAALAKGSDQLADGVQTLVEELPKKIAEQMSQLQAGVKKLSDGADTLATQSRQLKTGGAELAKGAEQLADGVGQYTDGATQLADGIGQYVDGVDKLSAGAGTYADGVEEFTAGVGKYTDGVGQYADGVHQAAVGGQQLAGGMTQLTTGSGKLSDGMRTFADKVSDGAKQVPSYDRAQREKLSSVVAMPVVGGADAVSTPLKQATTLLLVLGSWLGALATWLLVRPIASRSLTSSRPSWQLAAATMVPGATVAAAQALLLGILGSSVLHLGAAGGLKLTAFMILVALVFSAVNHALAAWFGGFGRALAALLAAVTAAVGLVSAVPGIFETVHDASPLAPALRGLRAIISGTPMGVGPVGTLLAVGVLAAVACVLAVVRRRQLSAAGYRRSADLAGQ